MDKNKIKEALKKKLRQEMSMTGTGASVTPGAGEGVATKYAFGKSNNKGTPSDWKPAPSIPNRPSKAMDYKELWEDNIEEAKAIGKTKSGKDIYLDFNNPSHKDFTAADHDDASSVLLTGKSYASITPARKANAKLHFAASKAKQKGITEAYVTPKTNADELARVEAYYKEATSSQKSSAEDRIKKLKVLVSLEKKHNTQLPVLTYGTYWVDYLKKQGVKDSKELDAKLSTKKEDINENYARFRNETKTRTKPEQFHNAVKSVKQKVNEINRLFEYMNRLQSELSESEGGLKHKKYTDKAIQSIKESTKQLFFKSTKLK